MAVGQERGPGGQYVMTEDDLALSARAMQLHLQKWSYRQIATELGISVGSAHQRVQRAMDKAIALPAVEAIPIMIDELETERGILKEARDKALIELENGRMIADPDDPDGPAVRDAEYILKVMDRLIKFADQIQKNTESLRRLRGLDQPAQTQTAMEVTYKITGMDDDPA